MNTRKILIAITNRSSYGKVKTVIEELIKLNHSPSLLLGNSLLIYRFGGVSANIMEDFPKLKVYNSCMAVEGDGLSKMAKSTGLGIIEFTTLIDQIEPSLILTVADRFETMATAISASYLNIPLAHIQGGENTGSIDDKVRNAITQFADLHFPATKNAGKLVRSIVKDPSKVHVTGCPSMDLMARYTPKAGDDQSLMKHSLAEHINNRGTGSFIDFNDRYIIVMFHADTTEYQSVDYQIHVLLSALDSIDIQKIIFWPNIDSGSDIIAKALRMYHRDGTRTIRNLDIKYFSQLLFFSNCIVGNSSAGIRESSFLGTPSVNIGNRQHGREIARNTVNVAVCEKDIVKAVKSQISQTYPQAHLYGDGNAGAKIANILVSELT